MKFISFVMVSVFLVILTGCAGNPAGVTGTVPSPSIAASQAPAASPVITNTTAPDVDPTVMPPDETETPIITDEPIPGLLENEWYDWDKVGAYPGASVVQCGDRIAFRMLKYLGNGDGEGEENYNSYLAFADPDGSNCLMTKIKDPGCPNYKDGWIYCIQGKNSICKVKADGSGLETVFREDDIEGTTETRLTCLLLVYDKMYVFEGIQHDTGEKSVFMRMNLDGSGKEVLDEFEHTETADQYSRSHYLRSLFCDSGKLYYTNIDLDNYRFDLYRFDIATNETTCLANGLATTYECTIAVRGDNVYYKDNEGLRVYTISTRKDKVFAPAKNIDCIDLALFDRWLLISSRDEPSGLYFYDMESGKLYFSEDVVPSNLVPTRNYLYDEAIEDSPCLWPIIFGGGTVVRGDEINSTK